MTLLAAATALVTGIETAKRTGHGDTRSNAIVDKLLSIAKLWIADPANATVLLPCGVGCAWLPDCPTGCLLKVP
jgi:hypothetical protein